MWESLLCKSSLSLALIPKLDFHVQLIIIYNIFSFYKDGEEPEVPLIDETKRQSNRSTGVAMDAQLHNDHHHQGQVELFDFEFWPIEHPSEPPDEDRPLKCPMPDSSVINVSIYL